MSEGDLSATVLECLPSGYGLMEFPPKIPTVRVTETKLRGMSDEELACLFVKLSCQTADEQSQANVRASNILVGKMMLVGAEQRRRGLEARRVLLPLLNPAIYPKRQNITLRARAQQVQHEAARELLAVEPQAARATLDALSASGSGYQKIRAAITIGYLEKGIFKPD